MRLSRALFLSTLLMLPAVAVERASDRFALVLVDPPLSRGTARARIEAAHLALRTALAARQFTVTGEARTVLNAVFVKAEASRVPELQALPGVAAVIPLRRYRPQLNKAVPLLNGPAAWQALGGEQNAGRGVKIAIIDSGIDQNHAAFQDNSVSTPPGFPICSGGDCAFTNSKVIVARSYVAIEAAGTAPNPAADSIPDDASPRDRLGHGTATASCAAGNTATGPSATISGMAPHAFLGNYKVFGSAGMTTEDALIQAVDDAVNDGMDILSLSLGSPAFGGPLDNGVICGLPSGQPCDPLAAALENAVAAGKIVVASAGNLGLTGVDASGNAIETLNTTASPAYAPHAIAVGATSNEHVWYAGLHVGGSNVPSNLATIDAQFGDGPQPKGAVTAPGVDVQTITGDPLGCSTIPQNSLSGDFAIIERGTCNFVVKVQNAQSAGAVGVILYDTSEEPVFTPGGLGNTQIPAALIGQDDGQALKTFIASNPGAPITLDPNPLEVAVNPPVSVADFSSRGPVTGTSQIKPDVVAVGEQLYMATQSLDPQGEVYSPTGYTIADGTSFAGPLVAGAAALVKQKNSSWTPAQVKSALVNNASSAVTSTTGGAPSVLEIGGGLVDAGAAAAAAASADPASVSFGALSSASRFPMSQTVQITNLGGSAETLSLAIAPTTAESNAHVSVSPTSLSLGPGQSGSVAVNLTGSLPQAGRYEGAITASGNGASLRIPYLYVLGDGKPAAIVDLDIGAPDFVGTVNQALQQGGLVFKVIDQYGVAVPGLPARFSAKTSGVGRVTAADGTTDVNGIAGAQITLGSTVGDQSFTGTAGGLTITFTGVARKQPAFPSNGVVNGASFAPGGVSPGSYISIFGTNLSDVTDQSIVAALSPNMDQASVSFDVPAANISVPGYLHYVSPGQINAQVPWELEGQSSVEMKVIVGQSFSPVVTVPVASYAPAFFANGGFAAALDSNNIPITTSHAAQRGQTIQLFASGLGPVTNQPPSGFPAPADPLARTTSQPTVTIGGQAASVSFSGLAPGFAGLYQLNVVAPANAPTGVQQIVVMIGGVSSPAANIAIQ